MTTPAFPGHPIRLEARDGALVRLTEIPPFVLMPEVLVWGSRIFTRAPTEIAERARPSALPAIYVEAAAWWIS